eukprot:364420_1
MYLKMFICTIPLFNWTSIIHSILLFSFMVLNDSTEVTEQSEIYNISVALEYQNKHIKCSKTYCEVICGANGACVNATVDAKQSHTFKLSCSSQLACQDLRVISGA